MRASTSKNSGSWLTQSSTPGVSQMNSAYDRTVVFPTELGKSRSRQLEGTLPAVVIPVGSTEQHGPHLPLDTDTRIAAAVAGAVTTRLAKDPNLTWLAAPAIAYGASGEHQSFPGTISIGTDALATLVLEYGRSATCW